MKKYIQLVVLVALFVVSTEASAKKKTIVEPVVNTDSIAVQMALKVGDYGSAITITYQQLSKDTGNVELYYDLAKFYFQSKQYFATINTCNEILVRDSMSRRALKLAALSFENLNQPQKAIDVYALMKKRFNDLTYFYDIATILFNSESYENCLKTLEIIINDSTSGDFTVKMTRKNFSGSVIEEDINLKAVAYNMAGVILQKEGRLEMAQKAFQTALEIEPSFVLANNNLGVVLKTMAQPQSAPASPSNQ